MPNHVTIEMKVSGPAKDIEAFVEAHMRDDRSDQNLDFNTFVTIPKDLIGTTSPAQEPRTDNQMEIARWKAEQKRLLDAYGASEWYTWCVNNWGTKWNAYDGSMQSVSDEEIYLSFLTAWSLPEPIFNAMFDKWPTLDFHIKCVEEGGCFSGTIDMVDGELFDNITDDNKQWKEYAADMLGYYDEDDDTNRVDETLAGLRAGRIDDQSTVNEIVLFIKEHRDEFADFVNE